MKTFFIVLKIIIKILLCFLLSIFFIGSIFIELLVAGPCIEIIFITILSIIMVTFTWFIAFIKVKYFNIFTKTILFMLLFILYIYLSMLSPHIRKAWDMDICVDDGFCKEGIFNMQDDKGNSIPINKQNCIKYGYKWHEKSKSCDLRSKN